jgi:catechol 2,3-dioxygenase-like lactoylglutathione lyase family enzyme
MTGRVQLALNVDDLTESVAFYTKLFGIEPAKVRPGYANWASLLGRVSVAARGHRVRMGRKAARASGAAVRCPARVSPGW